MELKWLEDFICLAETGSFSKAAEVRFVTQSAFSRRIKALENWLGTTLVERKAQPSNLTQDGIRFLENAEQCVRLFKKMRADFNHPANHKKHSLTIGIADTLSIHFFPKWIKAMVPDLTDYYFDLYSNRKSGASFFESLRVQEYDLLICYSGDFDSAEVDRENIVRQTVAEEMFVPVCSATFYKLHTPDFSCKEKGPYSYIGYKPNSIFPKKIERQFNKADYRTLFSPVMESSSAESIKALVKNDLGIAWLPKSTIREELENKQLILLGTNHHVFVIDIEMYRYTRNQKPKVAEFFLACKNKML